MDMRVERIMNLQFPSPNFNNSKYFDNLVLSSYLFLP